MNDEVFFITDDSCEPLDPGALSISSMHKSEWIKKYGSLDWSFESHEEAVDFIQEEIR